MNDTWDSLVERGRALLGAPPLGRASKATAGPSDPKWALGDLLAHVPDSLLARYAVEIGANEGELRRLRDVAAKWPATRRVAASWSAHRDLKDHAERFSLIRPGMTVREAAEAAGKQPIDAKPITRMKLDEKAALVVTLLMDKNVNDLVSAKLAERGAARRTQRAARMASDERSAEYKNAMRALRQAQSTKSPEVAFLEVIFKIQEAAEYVRAVVSAATETDSALPLVPENRRPELIFAVDALSDVADQALEVLRSTPKAGTSGTHVIEADVAKPRRELLEHAEAEL